ncbi:GNAT family N-acetyltransferase [Sporosarcina highlanderae]|uniref:GNAT family N-acetyltransferase n=1 Tax=Sporosarcina highlanderae TaxID=3035916 RepID=A0ABT8JS72_9BACL|nr:GNAT family N-acetyltransferase [Sporosarcina highlanderae]MDN4607857.1 GNAT family N-acetyltransferase [Sporosarcina highlanderae]
MRIREAILEDAEAIARVHVDSWRTTYNGIVSDAYLQQLSYEQRAENWRRGIGRNALVVAEDESGKIVGFATGGKERTGNYGVDGELYAIYLLQEVQGQGIGKRLTKEIARNLKNQGFSSMLVWVLELNPSKNFYKSLGGKPLAETMIEIGGENFNEIAYYWEDIGKIVD